MATYTWSASSNGDATVAGNWTPNLPSGGIVTGDTVVFAGNVPYECNWNVAVVGIMDIQAGFTGLVKFATNCIIETGLSINEERRITCPSATEITFNGTPAYHSNLAYVKYNCADMISEDGLLGNLHFVFAGSVRTTIDAGKYPHMTFKSGFRTDYIAPSFSANKYNVEMKSITIVGGTVTAPVVPSADDRLMNWIITSTGSYNGGSHQLNTSGSGVLFNGGMGTWTFQAKSSGFTFPVTGTPIYNNFIFTFENVIIDSSANGYNGFVGINSGAIVRLTNLTINSGASIKGSDTLGATIHLVNRPTIKGTWGFLPIADGIYHYKGIYNLGVSGGGTGLAHINPKEIPYGFTSQKLNTDGNFKFDDATGTLTIGAGGMIITAGAVGSPAANQLWVNPADSNKLYFGSSAVGGSGGGGSSTVDVVSNVATNTILGRNDSGSGDSEELTPAEVRTMLGIEAGSTADQTDAEIRAAVEAASDSNVFTDADHTKLNGIATGATAYTDADAIAAVEGEADLVLAGTIQLSAQTTQPPIGSVQLGEGTNANTLAVRTNYGYLNIGMQNASFCHLRTSASYFYFDKPLQFDGGDGVYAYNGDFWVRTDAGSNGTPTERLTILGGASASAGTRIGIANTSPATELDVNGAVRFRAPVEVIATDPAPAVAESGTIYGMVNTGAVNFTLPAGAATGTQFIVINTLGNDVTVRLADANDKLNGVANGTALATTINNGTTIVCLGDIGGAICWYVMGGI